MLNFYSWTSSTSLIDTPYVLLNNLNWEDSSFLLENDLFFIIDLLTSSFLSVYFSHMGFSNLSFLDLSLIGFDTSRLLSQSLLFDFVCWFDSFNISTSLWFMSYSTDYLMLESMSEESTALFIFSFVSYLNIFTLTLLPSSLYDNFFLNLNFILLDYMVFFKWFIFFILFLYLFRPLRLLNTQLSFYYSLSRFFVFTTSLSFENRISSDLSISLISFLLFIWVLLLMSFDDIFGEVIDLFHGFLVVLLIFIILFLLVKYSIHYFSFLENTVSEGYSTSYFSKQMVRDLSNTFALFLRFFLLLFRLNIYDGLDDFLDSYYIFFCDFDEDSYFDEDMLGTNFYHYFKDNQEDNVFFHPNEQDWLYDIFSRYWIMWSKLFLFLFFIVEEAFRIGLALYIFYLIIFEVHSVNLSYVEDLFISNKIK